MKILEQIATTTVIGLWALGIYHMIMQEWAMSFWLLLNAILIVCVEFQFMLVKTVKTYNKILKKLTEK